MGQPQPWIARVQYKCAAPGPVSMTVTSPYQTCTQVYTIHTNLACNGGPIAATCAWGSYDFSSLMGDDMVGSDGGSTYDYYLNVCGTLQSQPQCTQEMSSTSACQVQVNPKGASFDK